MLAAFLSSLLALVCGTARADLLLYDGFATKTDSQDRKAYLSSSATHALKDANAQSTAWTTGYVANSTWATGTGVIFTFKDNGLSLPTAFAEGVGAQFVARGGSLGYLQGGSNLGSTYRNVNRSVSSMPTSGTLYFRCLMSLEAKTLNVLKNTTHYLGAGLSTKAYEAKYDIGASLANQGFRVYFVGTAAGAVQLKVKIGGNQYGLLVDGVTAGTTYVCIVGIDYDKGTACAYAAPVADYLKSFDWTVKDLDATDVTGSAMKVVYIDGVYESAGGRVLFDEFAAGTELGDVAVFTPSAKPSLGTVSLSRTGAATYSVSAEESVNTADTMSWIANDGTAAPTTNAFATAVAAGTTGTGTLSGLTADKTYQISVLAENASGSDEKTAGVIYTGALTLDADSATDANEYGLVAGGVTVSRAAADPFPLTVTYTISGSAGAEGTTWEAPVAVTIPANETSAVLPVKPLMDGDVTADVAITVALAAGNYELPASNAATLTLLNLAAPAGKKTWTATADGNASDGANWTPSGAPAATDEILFDGNFSNARCIWDATATHTVASWTQEASFSGTIELQTTYESGAFAALAVTEDCTISGGTVTQMANSEAQVYRLSMTVGGDLSIASGAKITATGKGYAQNRFPTGSAVGVHGGSANDLSKVYGDLKHPIDIGSGGYDAGKSGGGAIHLVVSGNATVDGTLVSQPATGNDSGDTRYKGHGAGGSIYLSAASVAGSGSISAAGYGFSNSWQRPGGAGGRIAVICTTAESLAFPASKIMCNGSIAGYGNTTGAGTIFVKTASQQNGTLIVDNAFASANFEAFWPTKRGVTPIPVGETWTLDEILFRRYGVLCVPEGTTLSVPLSGVSSSSDRTAGILYEGGTLNIGSAPYTLTGKWTFQADAPYTFNGDVTITGGANIGGLQFCGNYTNDFAKCDVTVNGNLTIAADGYASATMAGPVEENKNGGPFPRHGGQYATLSGNKCYGSVFDPALPGYFAQAGDHATAGVGGGVLKLTVTGDFVVNGSVSANSAVFSKSSAAAGSVSITAQTLSGSGSITATGVPGSIQWDNGYNGVGGRISVRVTGEDVGTTGIWTKFAALGCSTNQVVANGKITADVRNQNTSAGTIYLQGKSDGEKGGTIYVKNQKNYDTSDVATWIPAAERGDSAADFAKAKLVIADRGVVAIGAAKMKFAELTVEDNSLLDLHGETLRVKRATFGGTRLAGGKYTAATLPDFLRDSGEGGVLEIGGGFSVTLR